MKAMKGNIELLFICIMVTFAMLLDGCSMSSTGMRSSAGGSYSGATPGGAQDIGYARQVIENGGVPPESSITVEGLFSEHDLPIGGATCNERLCLNSAVAITDLFVEKEIRAFLQIGLGSNIDLSTFHRNSLNLGVVVDRSGSMCGEKMEAVITALKKLVDNLNEEDVLSIVIFDDIVDVILEPTHVDDRGRINSIIDREIVCRGSTDIESALRRGFEIVNSLEEQGLDRRVMLFTDALPNTGRTDEDSFVSLVTRYAEEGVGISVFGVGVDFGHELIDAITHAPGGNYFFLEDADKIAKVFDEDFDLMVTPIAYNLKVSAVPAQNFSLSDVHGVPGWDDSSSGKFEINLATVFISRNRGAIVVELKPEAEINPGEMIASVELKYSEQFEGQVKVTNLDVRYEGEDVFDPSISSYYQPVSVRKVTALLNLALGMKEVCRLYHDGDVEGASRMAGELVEYFRAEVEAVGGDDMEEELALVEKLKDNINSGN